MYTIRALPACSPIASADALLISPRRQTTLSRSISFCAGRGIDAILGEQVDLAPEHAARRVDLVDRERRGAQAVLPKLAEKARAWREVANFYGVGLRPHDRRKAHRSGGRGDAHRCALLEGIAASH